MKKEIKKLAFELFQKRLNNSGLGKVRKDAILIWAVLFVDCIRKAEKNYRRCTLKK